MEVRERAYAPYSSFKVGAALKADGKVFTGCNVENSSYPVGICAERSALVQAVSAGCTEIEALVVAAEKVVTPCGMCRQALSEFGTDFPVLLAAEDQEKETTFEALFPEPFKF